MMMMNDDGLLSQQVVLVSDVFQGKTLLQRHRVVNGLLAEQLQGPVHALSLHLKTAEEWKEAEGQIPRSPPCGGGSKHG